MTRQEKLSEIGKLKLSEYSLKMIIPCPHNFYDNNINVFSKIKDWEILNKSTDKKAFNAYNIKTYIYGNVVPELNDNNSKRFLDKNKTVILTKKLDDGFKLKDFKFNISELHLCIFDEHIAFFSLEIKLENFTEFPIDEISEFHQLIRQYKFFNIKAINNKYKEITSSGYDETSEFIDYLLNLTNIENKSFLNISLDDCKFKSTKNQINETYHIYNSTTNAKLLIGMQTKATQYSDGKEIEELEENELTFVSTNNVSILEEATFYIATCSSLSPRKDFTPNDNYIYDCLSKNKLSLWKYSLGVILHDNAVFLGLNKDGGNVIANVNSSFYFIYILNLYIYNQVKYLEHKIIDSSFESVEIDYYYEQLQKLKNQFISDEVAIKFQENELNSVISKALKIDDSLEQVSNNLLETKEISQNNRTLILAILTYPLINNFIPFDWIANNIILSSIFGVIGLIAIYYLISKRKKIKKMYYKRNWFKKVFG
ncbi:hypothetical protein [Arcobacter sp. s6]|uniref:hypothetical protein n=1 Tax=Arcobacter sp. s6 TaxID=3230363 RepID=UPI0034A00B32